MNQKNLEEAIRKIGGEGAIPLYKALKNKKNFSEFKLAEKLKLEINVTRNLLYKLYHANLVYFTRKKDKEKGWYIYYWTLKAKGIYHIIALSKKESLETMKTKLMQEKETYFFMCKNNCVRLNFDHAVDINYKCPECGELMQQIDNREKVAKLESDVKILEKELGKKIASKKEKKKAIKKTACTAAKKLQKKKHSKKKTSKR